MRVELVGLTKRFPNMNKKIKSEVLAVSDVNLSIPDGELIALLGPSGCGKSTTLNLICGLEKPSEGKIIFGEEDVTSLQPELRGVGMVFQNYALYPHLTVEQNITFPLENFKKDKKLSKEEMKKRAYEAAKLVQIEQYMERKPKELSGGQQQRVAIARALVKLPKILLLDEPLSNLDARLRLQTREEIRRIQRETGITTIFVTHDQDEALSIADTIVVMKDGVIHQVGKPQEVYDNPADLFVAKFLGTPAINVFEGRICDKALFIGKDRIIDVPSCPDKDVYVGIRPEGFILNENGVLGCRLSGIEVRGRDISLVSKNENCITGNIRSIIASDSDIDDKIESIRFDIKKVKLCVFDKETEERIEVG